MDNNTLKYLYKKYEHLEYTDLIRKAINNESEYKDRKHRESIVKNHRKNMARLIKDRNMIEYRLKTELSFNDIFSEIYCYLRAYNVKELSEELTVLNSKIRKRIDRYNYYLHCDYML